MELESLLHLSAVLLSSIAQKNTNTPFPLRQAIEYTTIRFEVDHQSSIEASINSNTNQVVIKRENSRIKENQFSVNLSKIQM
jgi:hypothetical protein